MGSTGTRTSVRQIPSNQEGAEGLAGVRSDKSGRHQETRAVENNEPAVSQKPGELNGEGCRELAVYDCGTVCDVHGLRTGAGTSRH